MITELELLLEQVKMLPPEQAVKLLPIINKMVELENQRKGMFEKISEALLSLKTDMKYMVFDLEATRRERDEALGRTI